MKTRGLGTLLVGMTALIVSLSAEQSGSAEMQSLLDNRVNTAKKVVGIVAGTVDTTGTRIYSSGETSAGGGHKPDGDTLFEIGSMTKVFTSLLLAEMIERGEVKADDPVAKYLPADARMPSRDGHAITLLNLSMQDSGLPRLPENLTPVDPANPYADYDGAKLLQFLGFYKLTRAPGEKYEYSNLGAGLLGFALSRRAGMTYEQLVTERIFKPLHMNHSRVSLSAEDKKRLAVGYDGALQPVKNWDFDALAGAGAIRSTADDLLKFMAANLGLADSQLKRAMERMRTVRKETDMPHIEIAMAWHIFGENPPDIYWHNGGTGGYRSFGGMDIAGKKAVVVLANTAYDIDDIGKHALNEKYPAAMLPEVREMKLESSVLSEYEGSYHLAPTFAIQFTARDGHLYEQATGQPEFEVFASAKDEFFLKVVEARVSFTRDANGKVTGMVLHQNGQDVPGPRAH